MLGSQSRPIPPVRFPIHNSTSPKSHPTMTKSKHNHSRKPSNASNTHSRKPSNAYSILPTHSTTHSSDSETSSPASSKKSSTPSIDISDIHSHLSTLEDELKISLSNIVGVLLNLNCDEVTELKSCIRHELRFRTVTVSTFDVYYPTTGQKSELLCKKGQAQLGWHLSPSKTTSLIRSSTVFAVALEFPQLFKEPTTLEDFRREWTPNTFGCYPIVPFQFRRDILARMVEICGEEMKKDKSLRAGATDPKPYKKKPALSPESTSTPAANKRARVEASSTNTSSSLKREHMSLE
ncbi:hypothetical protein D6D15_09678 [Aureobasidium pullulans]|uniref:Uncharacterized protein n=1 Tax=Aureobasidium pullulans TaxID=5580 RepID=A0A4S9ATB3_AURPU|nr:hypothetical protein D6D15_09678 [Aureobasidium pullulans]